MYPYLLTMQAVLAASGAGTCQYTVPNTEELIIHRLMFTSTGAFSVTDIRDTGGIHYTNASPSIPIPSTLIASGANNNNNIGDLPGGVYLEGGNQFNIDVVDTSAAPNTVKIIAVCERGSKGS